MKSFKQFLKEAVSYAHHHREHRMGIDRPIVGQSRVLHNLDPLDPTRTTHTSSIMSDADGNLALTVLRFRTDENGKLKADTVFDSATHALTSDAGPVLQTGHYPLKGQISQRELMSIVREHWNAPYREKDESFTRLGPGPSPTRRDVINASDVDRVPPRVKTVGEVIHPHLELDEAGIQDLISGGSQPELPAAAVRALPQSV